MGRRLATLVLCLGAAACGQGGPPVPDGDPAIAADPVIARALHDPLMSDPDLASRNEANAALGFPDSHALPVLRGSSEAAQAAREALRLELLAAGPIPALPPASEGAGGPALGPLASPAMLLAAVAAPETCARALREDFALAASLPPVAAIPPGAMVMQAGGADRPGCRLRIIRYRSAAPIEDLLQYHLTRALRAGLAGQRFAAPEDIVIGKGAGESQQDEALAVHVRPAAHGLNGVEVIYRAP
jgi:hypothetical protein